MVRGSMDMTRQRTHLGECPLRVYSTPAITVSRVEWSRRDTYLVAECLISVAVGCLLGTATGVGASHGSRLRCPTEKAGGPRCTDHDGGPLSRVVRMF